MTTGFTRADGLLTEPQKTREAWILVAPMALFAPLWILGISSFIWILIAFPIALRLLRSGEPRIPRGFGLWIVFLGWVALSFSQVGSLNSALVASYRASIYVSAGVLLIYAFNLPSAPRYDKVVLSGIAAYWGTLAGLGVVALLIPTATFQSGLESLLPAGLQNEPYVQQLVHPTLAQLHSFLGYPTARPAAPFAYTNEWGSGIGLFAPIYLYWASRLRGRGRFIAFGFGALSLVPIVASLNRGLWLSLIAAAAYASVRYALAGRVRPLMVVLWAGVIISLTLVLTPLGDVVRDRSETGHSDNARLTLYESSIEAAIASPVTGHGGTVQIVDRADRAPAGTHGQIWLILVSHGVPAAMTYLAFIAVSLVATWRFPINSAGFWTHIVLVISLIHMFLYSLLPSLPVMFIMLGLTLRRGTESELRRQLVPSSPR